MTLCTVPLEEVLFSKEMVLFPSLPLTCKKPNFSDFLIDFLGDLDNLVILPRWEEYTVTRFAFESIPATVHILLRKDLKGEIGRRKYTWYNKSSLPVYVQKYK